MALAKDQKVVETLQPHRSYPSLGERVRLGCLDRSVDDSDALGPEHLVERDGELGVSVADQEPDVSKPLPPTARFRACCVSPAESGFLVTPRTSTRLDPSSIVKSTYSVRSHAVSTVKKSRARIA